MMDVREFAKVQRRMCGKYPLCKGCPLNDITCRIAKDSAENDEEIIKRVEKWAKERPVKTRQGEFLKLFPNARLAPDGLINACVRDMDGNHPCDWKCIKCRNDYWLEEVE